MKLSDLLGKRQSVNFISPDELDFLNELSAMAEAYEISGEKMDLALTSTAAPDAQSLAVKLRARFKDFSEVKSNHGRMVWASPGRGAKTAYFFLNGHCVGVARPSESSSSSARFRLTVNLGTDRNDLFNSWPLHDNVAVVSVEAAAKYLCRFYGVDHRPVPGNERVAKVQEIVYDFEET